MLRTFGFGILGAMLGEVAGGVLGLGGGLAWTELAGTPDFEGFSGFVVAYWIAAGVFLGFIAGAVAGVFRGRR